MLSCNSDYITSFILGNELVNGCMPFVTINCGWVVVLLLFTGEKEELHETTVQDGRKKNCARPLLKMEGISKLINVSTVLTDGLIPMHTFL